MAKAGVLRAFRPGIGIVVVVVVTSFVLIHLWEGPGGSVVEVKRPSHCGAGPAVYIQAKQDGDFGEQPKRIQSDAGEKLGLPRFYGSLVFLTQGNDQLNVVEEFFVKTDETHHFLVEVGQDCRIVGVEDLR